MTKDPPAYNSVSVIAINGSGMAPFRYGALDLLEAVRPQCKKLKNTTLYCQNLDQSESESTHYQKHLAISCMKGFHLTYFRPNSRGIRSYLF